MNDNEPEVYMDEALAKCTALGLRLCSMQEIEELCCETFAPRCTEVDDNAWRKYRIPYACGPKADLSAPVWSSDACLHEGRDWRERAFKLFSEMGCREEDVPTLGQHWVVLPHSFKGGRRIDSDELSDHLAGITMHSELDTALTSKPCWRQPEPGNGGEFGSDGAGEFGFNFGALAWDGPIDRANFWAGEIVPQRTIARCDNGRFNSGWLARELQAKYQMDIRETLVSLLKNSQARWDLRFDSYIELDERRLDLRGCVEMPFAVSKYIGAFGSNDPPPSGSLPDWYRQPPTCKYVGISVSPDELFPPGGPAAGCWGAHLTDEQLAKSEHVVLANATTLLNETELSLREASPSELPRGTVDVVGLNFRNVRVPRAGRIKESYLKLSGASGGAEFVGTADHVGTQISAISNCAEAARGPEAASNWSFPSPLVKLCKEECSVFDPLFGVKMSFVNDGFCDDGGEK